MLSKTQVEQYYDEGYTVAELFNKNNIAVFKSELALAIRRACSLLRSQIQLDQAILGDANSCDEYLVHEAMILLERLDHKHLSEIYNIIGFSSILMRLLMEDFVISAVNQILDRPETSNLFVNSINCRMDPPGQNSYLYGWHKDRNSNIPGSRFVQLWAPVITSLSRDQGAILVAAGSHKNPNETTDYSTYEQEALAKGGPIRTPVSAIPTGKQFEEIAVEIDLGQVLLFQPDLFHRSGLNVTTNRMRYCISGMYHDPAHPSFKYMNLNMK